MKTHNKLVYLMVAALLFNVPGAQGQESRQQRLDADSKRRVVFVGQNLLRANRTYEVDEDVLMVREQLTVVREKIQELQKPLSEVIKLSDEQNQNSFSSLSGQEITETEFITLWKSARSKEISEINLELTTLSKHCANIRNKQSEPNQSIWSQIRTYLSGDDITRNAVILPISESALQQLENLPDELEQAINLPVSDRYQKFNELSKSLELHSKAIQLTANVQSSTPTMTTRTTHR